MDVVNAVFWRHSGFMWFVGATKAADTMVGGHVSLKKGGEGRKLRYF